MSEDDHITLPAPTGPGRLPSPLEHLASIPEEENLAAKGQKSARTRRAYRASALDARRATVLTPSNKTDPPFGVGDFVYLKLRKLGPDR
jgi:hypothetical protein